MKELNQYKAQIQQVIITKELGIYCDNNSAGLSTQVTISLMLMRLSAAAAVANSRISWAGASSVCQIIIFMPIKSIQY